MYKIAIVEDMLRAMHTLLRELGRFPEIEVVLAVQNGDEFLQQLKNFKPGDYPQLVLMDVDMPVMNGIETVRNSALLYPSVKYIMLTVADDDDKLFEAIKAGAHGYLLKEETTASIVASIKEVLEKEGAPMSPRIARKTLKLLADGNRETIKPVESRLSDREMEVLKQLVNGDDYNVIAEKLFISPNTVRNHIAKIYEKLHVTSKARRL